MKEEVRPSLEDLTNEAVLFQAWKKTTAYIRSHNWYADTLELDWQALRVPAFIKGIRERIAEDRTWETTPLQMVPAPKSQQWIGDPENWRPERGPVKIRPLAHVDLADQVVATAILLCLADRVETEQGNPVASIKSTQDRRTVLSYGHRLFCDSVQGKLRHRWGSKKLYRQFSTDYQRFLSRPDRVAEELVKTPGLEVAIVHTDLSRFYDRVRPKLLSQKLRALRWRDEENDFFKLASAALNWEWADEKRARQYESTEGIEGFQAIALPQGLVSAGFFSNVVLLGFDERLRQKFGQTLHAASSYILHDASRYVDDLRLVIEVPQGSDEDEISSGVASWINEILADETPASSRLLVQLEKTKTIVRNRRARFMVPQSRTARRIQHEISGGFDVTQGTQLISAIEGFFHTQRSYPADGGKNDADVILRGASDMRDDTAARFAAVRFRRTFRSLRPLLETDGPAQIDDAETPDIQLREIVLSREQLDERADVFAAGLVEGWESNPSHVRLLRVGLDLCPRPDFLERVLSRLRPAWQQAGMRGPRREVLAYCLAELFRAGATETGIVADDEVLPASSDVRAYHEVLLKEALAVCRLARSSAPTRFPWYLRQQAMLYVFVRGAAGQLGSTGVKNLSKSPLYRYILYRKFATGRETATQRNAVRFYFLATRCFGQADLIDRALNDCDENMLRLAAEFAPGFAEELWLRLDASKRADLAVVATSLRLDRRSATRLLGELSVADAATSTLNPWQDERNLLVLAHELLKARQAQPEGVLTPWRVVCEFEPARAEDTIPAIRKGSVQIRTARGGEAFFSPPDWCESDDEKISAEVGQILRFCLTGTLDFLRPVPKSLQRADLPRYRPAPVHWEQTRYGVFQGRSAFGPAWLPLSTWVEKLLLALLRAPGTGQPSEELHVATLRVEIEKRVEKLDALRGSATGVLFLEQDAPFPHKARHKEWERPLRIGVVQSVVPSDAEILAGHRRHDLQLNDSTIRQKHRRHLRAIMSGVQQMLRVRETHREHPRNDGGILDWLIFPELAIHPDDVGPILLPFVRAHRCLLTAGLTYHPRDPAGLGPLINSAVWLIPEWTPHHGLQVRQIEQGKARLAPEEARELGGSVIGFRPAQWVIHYHWHHTDYPRPLLLSASICYDATDLSLAADLRDRNDFHAVCALNHDVQTFDNLAASLNFHMFQGILVVNNGTYGGSSFFAPLKDAHKRQILHFHGQPQALIGFAEVSPRKMILRPRDVAETSSPEGRWKSPPAGWVEPIF